MTPGDEAAEQGAGARLTVVAYNVEFGKATTPEGVAAELADRRPDVVCFCEAPGGEWTETVGALLGAPHSFVGRLASANHREEYREGTGRFFGKFKSILSRTPLRDAHEVELRGVGWQPASAVLARTTVAGCDFLIGALHVPSGSPDPERSCAADVVDVMGGYADERVILGGDYNDLTHSPPLQRLYDVGFRNPWVETGFDVERAKTHHARTDQDSGVIDHLLFRGPLHAVSAAVIRSPEPQSDHFPIETVFAFHAC